jgi:hypothetical protein
VFVQDAHLRVAKQNATATVRLQPVLVRVDDYRIDLCNARERFAGVAAQFAGNTEIATVRGIRVYPEFIFLLQFQDVGQWIDGAYTGGAERRNDGTNVAGLELFLERGNIHATVRRSLDRGKIQAEDFADPAVRVMCV